MPIESKNYSCYHCLNEIEEANHLDELPFLDNDLEDDIIPEDSFVDLPESKIDWEIFKKRGLHFVHINVNSLLTKIDELRYIAQKSEVSVIGISESKLYQSILDGEIDIEGYELERNDRNRQVEV